MTSENIPCGACSYNPNLVILSSWSLELPFEAVSANQLKSNRPGQSGFKYRKLRNDIEKYLKQQYPSVLPAVDRRRAFFTRHFAKPKRSFDRDNLIAGFKPIRDCLTLLGWLVDDSEKYLESHYKQIRGEQNFITIDLEDIAW